MATASRESGAVKKVLLVVFVLYILSNHAVRFAAAGSSSHAVDGLARFTSIIAPSTVASLNGFRLRTGDAISRTGYACPLFLEKYCQPTAQGVRVVLGLH